MKLKSSRKDSNSKSRIQLLAAAHLQTWKDFAIIFQEWKLDNTTTHMWNLTGRMQSPEFGFKHRLILSFHRLKWIQTQVLPITVVNKLQVICTVIFEIQQQFLCLILNAKDAKLNSWILLVLASPVAQYQCPDCNLQDVQPALGRLS